MQLVKTCLSNVSGVSQACLRKAGDLGSIEWKERGRHNVSEFHVVALVYDTHQVDGHLNRGNIYICKIRIIGSFVLHVTDLNETGNLFSK